MLGTVAFKQGLSFYKRYLIKSMVYNKFYKLLSQTPSSARANYQYSQNLLFDLTEQKEALKLVAKQSLRNFLTRSALRYDAEATAYYLQFVFCS